MAQVDIFGDIRPQVGNTTLTLNGENRYLTSTGKRAIDLSLAIPGLLVTVPIVAIAAGINKILEPHEPAFYQTQRVGKDGKLFPVLKLRSMSSVVGKETYSDETSPSRLKSFGKWLRRSTLDEMPQLLAVIKGDMSLVGIRAVSPDILEGLEQRLGQDKYTQWYQEYISARPACTGITQTSGNRDLPENARVANDIHYSNHASLKMDLFLIAKTPLAVLRGKGLR